jgi:hypothetical protein
LNLFTGELAHNLNPGMIALEKLEYRHKPAVFPAAEAHLYGSMASQISVDPRRFSMIE